jgi:hypothetical protein
MLAIKRGDDLAAVKVRKRNDLNFRKAERLFDPRGNAADFRIVNASTQSVPQLLGYKDAITDAERRFQISYSFDQLQSGEGVRRFVVQGRRSLISPSSSLTRLTEERESYGIVALHRD